MLGPVLGALAFLAGQDARGLNARLAGARVRLALAGAADGPLAGVTVEGVVREVLPDAAATGRGAEARKRGTVAVIHLDPHPRVTWREVAVFRRDAGHQLWMARWVPIAVHVHAVDRARPAPLDESDHVATASMRLSFLAREQARVHDPAAAAG